MEVIQNNNKMKFSMEFFGSFLGDHYVRSRGSVVSGQQDVITEDKGNYNNQFIKWVTKYKMYIFGYLGGPVEAPSINSLGRLAPSSIHIKYIWKHTD